METSSAITSFSVSGGDFILDQEESILVAAETAGLRGQADLLLTITAIAPDDELGATQDITVKITDVNDSRLYRSRA